ncbi:MAG: DUF5915 domain-containing protein, partial [Acidimicrobiia bacterium]
EVQIRASSHEELALAQDGALAVALDTTLDASLRREGQAREVVRALNDQRKAQGFEIADRIVVALDPPAELEGALTEHGPWIAGEVLAVELDLGTFTGEAVDLTIDGVPLRARLTPAG